MRKIIKSTNIPLTLQHATVPLSVAQVSEAVYKARDVRNQLVADQFYKCAYCESPITIPYNDVEHYRPKNHYYWLGHSWDNLLYSCDLCNRTYKNASFPLKDESKRVLTPGDTSGEEPLIINPTIVDPATHIKFRRYEAVAVTVEGAKTIEIFHLNDRDNRPELVDARERLYEQYKIELQKIEDAEKILEMKGQSQKVYDIAKAIIMYSKRSIQNMQSPDTPYSGMLMVQIP